MAPRLCFVHLLVLLLLTAAPAVARQDLTATPLDLAAMILTPDDLAAAGWDGLELASGQTLSADDLAYRAVWPQGAGEEQDAVRDALLAAGWHQGYAATFDTPWDANRTNPGYQAEVEIVVYADASGAAAGFALIPDVYATGPVTPVTGTRRIGDDSRLVRVAARDPQAGVPSQELALGLRLGHLTAHVLLRDWTGGKPTVAAIETIADRLLARIASVAHDGGSD
jgi:hypothetical protein